MRCCPSSLRRIRLLAPASPPPGTGYKGVTFGYTPATGTWRLLAPGPAPRMAQNNEIALWTGSQMLVIGLTNAAYNPAASTWHRIAPYNGPVGAVGVWTGHQVIMWGGGCCGGVTAAGAACTPATRTWRKLPPLPQARGGTALWDGTELLYIGGTRHGASAPSADGFAFSPATGRWRWLPAMEFSRTGFAAVWTGHQVLVWGGWTGSFTDQQIPPHGVRLQPSGRPVVGAADGAATRPGATGRRVDQQPDDRLGRGRPHPPQGHLPHRRCGLPARVLTPLSQ
ncbi:MAG TPA: kelch repeat-containing protein, partial [Streptosporangiaceae bacterium]|nr:kelch repeat-containing protein [Streptosporangiaceae bacterium]